MIPSPPAAGRPARGRRIAALKQRTAALSVMSNSLLILLKVIAGTITGSVAVLTEAVHSSIDLVASIVAFFSVRKAGEPADESHRYGHEKIENLSAAIEGILILVGSAAIAFAAIRRLLGHGKVEKIGFGIVVVAVSIVVNVVISAVISRRAGATESPALEGDAAHLRTDAMTSAGVLLGLALVQLTGAQWIDPVVALIIAGVIVITGVRLLSRSSQVLVDQALPPDEVDAIRVAIEAFAPRGVVGYHELRTRRAGSRRYVDLHVQFRAGTSLEDAHRTAHELQDLIASKLHGADVLIHLEPQDRVRPGEELLGSPDGTRGAGGLSRPAG
jgi:cation diffusion facilitator family transporter